MRRAAAICAAMALATPGAAQDQITPDEFLDRAVGNTLSFYAVPSGRLVGIEEFLRRDLSVWRPRGGDCTYGRITVENGQLCFLYEELSDQPVCWYTFDMEGTLMVRLAQLSELDVQEVRDITTKSLNCPEEAIS